MTDSIAQHARRWRADKATVATAPVATDYVIRLSGVAVYAATNFKWLTLLAHAQAFATHAAAVTYATDTLSLTPLQYTVEAR